MAQCTCLNLLKPSFLQEICEKISHATSLYAKCWDHCLHHLHYTLFSEPLFWGTILLLGWDLNPKSLATNKGQGRGRVGNKILMEQIFSGPKWPLFIHMTPKKVVRRVELWFPFHRWTNWGSVIPHGPKSRPVRIDSPFSRPLAHKDHTVLYLNLPLLW